MNKVNIPKLLRAKSTVYLCGSCGAWLGRIPAFMGDASDKGDQCEKCGATSFRRREGRPFGPKSKHWDWVLYEWEYLYETLITTPEFRELLDTATFETNC